MPSIETPLLECRTIRKSYRLGRRVIPVLHGVDLQAPEGALTLIQGKSGAGKSTLLYLLAGLDAPDAGEVLYRGRRLSALPSEELATWRREQVGIIFQAHNLLPSWTALENVEAALMHSGLSATRRREQAQAALVHLGLADRLDNLPAELSAGQQQRVAIARALARRPRLVFADEPTSDLDPETAREILDYLLGPVREQGATLVVTTHGLFPLELADHLLTLEAGLVTPVRERVDIPQPVAVG